MNCLTRAFSHAMPGTGSSVRKWRPSSSASESDSDLSPSAAACAYRFITSRLAASSSSLVNPNRRARSISVASSRVVSTGSCAPNAADATNAS